MLQNSDYDFDESLPVQWKNVEGLRFDGNSKLHRMGNSKI